MPIYSYKCTACQHEVDVLQKISDPPPEACPNCGAAALVKRLTAAGFQLKGSGWYATDFKNGPAKKEEAPKDGAPPDQKTAASESKDSEAKPAAEAAPAQPAPGKDAPAQAGTAGGGG